MYWPHEGGKEQVARVIHDLEMRPFAFTEHIGGQGYTNHSRWLASSLPYELPFIQQLVCIEGVYPFWQSKAVRPPVVMIFK
jgi:hypothetical protein